MRHHVTLAAVSLATLFAPRAHSQAIVAEPRLIPVEIAHAAAGPFVEVLGSARYSVGRTPEGWPTALVPSAPATIIGGAMTPLYSTALFAYRSAGWTATSAAVTPELAAQTFFKSERATHSRAAILIVDGGSTRMVTLETVPMP